MTEKASLNRDAFLFCISQTGNMTVAADFIGTSREQIMAEMTQDAGFAKQVKKAIEESFDRLLYQAHQRALYGVKVPHFYQGELIGYSARPSDRLLRYLLKRMETALHQEDETACESHIDVEHIRQALKQRLAMPVLSETSSDSSSEISDD